VNRTKAYLMALMGLGGMLLLASASHGQTPGAAAPPTGAQPAAGGRPTIAVFNMAAVMREYGKAKHQVYTLNKQRDEMSRDIMAWRSEYIKLQEDGPKQQVAELRDQMAKRMVELQRKIQDKEAEVSKVLNEQASTIISQLYDDIKTVVDKTAEMNGYHIVFAYPDAVTAEEKNNAGIKELKLKPSAAFPFYVAKHVDMTNVVIQTLNAWYPAPKVPDEPPAGNGAPPATGPVGGAPASGAPLPGQGQR
jgi:Skp family chaperone for outer membrane proteins